MARFGLTSLLLAALTLSASACDQKAQAPDEPSVEATTSAHSDDPDQPVSNSFPTATSVRLFVESGEPAGDMNYSKPAGTLLSSDQRKFLDASLMVTKIPEEMAACFIPHHFFRFYDPRGKQVGELSICFCCAGVRVDGESNISVGQGRLLNANYARVEALVRELGERTDIHCD